MKTEQEIKKLAEKVCYSEAWGYEKGYTQAQTDMQAELEAKDSEIARLKAELQEAKDDAVGFQKYLLNNNIQLKECKGNGELLYINKNNIIWFYSELYKHYEQSKTQNNGK